MSDYSKLKIPFVENKELQEALVSYEKSLEQHPAQTLIDSNLATDLEQRGFLRNDLVNILAHKARLFIEQDSLEKAVAYYKQALSLDPSHAYILYDVGKLHEMQGKLEEANTYYRKASVLTKFDSENDVLAVFFSSLYGKFASYQFQSFWVSAELDIQKIFFRDVQDVWYNSGLLGIAKDIDEIAAYLQSQIEQLKVNKVVSSRFFSRSLCSACCRLSAGSL